MEMQFTTRPELPLSTTMFVIVVAPACCCCCCCSCSSSCCSYCRCSCCWWPLPANEAHNKHGPKNPSLALSLSLTFPLALSFPPFAPVACHNIDRTRKVAALSRGRHSRLCCTALSLSFSLPLALSLAACRHLIGFRFCCFLLVAIVSCSAVCFYCLLIT